MDDDGWEVKEVVDVKFNKKTSEIEFQLEWMNWDGDPTWEPEDNCACPDLIQKFQETHPDKWEEVQRQRNKHLQQTTAPATTTASTTIASTTIATTTAATTLPDKPKNGFQRKAKLEKIVAADMMDGYLVYIVKFDDSDHLETIERKACEGRGAHVEQQVLKFLIKRITFRN